MLKITSTELRKNLDKYILLGQKEDISVSYKGKVVFTIVPKRIELVKRWKKVFGILPKEAMSDNDIGRE